VTTTDLVLELSDVSKDYRGLRPLRISRLAVAAGERVALVGLDAVAAEVFVNLITGASLPDHGDVRVFSRSTKDITDSSEWLSVVDRFGIVSARAVLLDALSVVQNLAMPFTLDVEPPAEDVRARAVALAREVGLPEGGLDRPVGELNAAGRIRVRLGRAVALNPSVVILEHPTAELGGPDALVFAERCREIAKVRNVTLLTLTADHGFGERVAGRVLTHHGATGRLSGGGWLSRLRRD
jgi:ABC-type transporter Mla maintaining outer membrane lipid asymmetry ATPase subunit MlaF